MVETLPDQPRKGRGAVTNRSGRYEAQERISLDDGWRTVETEAEDGAPPLRTSVTADSSRSIIARNQSPDVPFDRSINPYRGCEHGCIYCFARPTHAWLGLSAGLDFETRLFAKFDAASLLEQALAKPSYKPALIAMGTNTDPYQPVEKRFGITRQVLEVLRRTRHPLGIVTKSDLILRDLDILGAMAERGLVKVYLSVTTLDSGLARIMEPRAPTPGRRLAAIRQLRAADVPTGVMAAPMIPALNDDELERILEAAVDAGALDAGYILLRLPLEIRDLFVEWLGAHFPDRKARIMKLIREARGGRDYESAFGLRMSGRGVYAEALKRRFALASKRLGLEKTAWLPDTSQFRPPSPDRDQLSLF